MSFRQYGFLLISFPQYNLFLPSPINIHLASLHPGTVLDAQWEEGPAPASWSLCSGVRSGLGSQRLCGDQKDDHAELLGFPRRATFPLPGDCGHSQRARSGAGRAQGSPRLLRGEWCSRDRVWCCLFPKTRRCSFFPHTLLRKVLPALPQGDSSLSSGGVERDGVATEPQNQSHSSLGMCLRCYSSDSLQALGEHRLPAPALCFSGRPAPFNAM